jgi:hypothetical protein
MRPRRLPIIPTLVAAYRDWGRIVIAMRPITLSAILILIMISVGAEFVPQRLWEQQLSGVALGLTQNAIWAFLLAPFIIALHRFVILGEIMPAYTLPIGEPAFLIFFGWLFALKVLVGLPIDLLGALQALNWSLRASTIVFVVALIAAAFVSLRLSLLLPACAVKSPGATPSRALADTSGEASRIFAILFLALLPWLAADIGGVFLLGPSAHIIGTPLAMVSLVMGGILQTITLSLTTVIASYAFMALAAHVKRTAEL